MIFSLSKKTNTYLLQLYTTYPEIFPEEMDRGFCFHDWVVSVKQQLVTLTIKFPFRTLYA